MAELEVRAAIAAIDAANADDPNTIEVRGEVRPKELAHADADDRVGRALDPNADDAQLLAARAHHLRRWTVPRSSYPEGRAGYLRWRTALQEAARGRGRGILRDVGYDDATIDRVQRIIRKEGLGTDPAVQTHEDALCLVFLETQLAATVDDLGDDKMLDVIRKTAEKMSDRGPAPGRATCRCEHDDRALIGRALADPSAAGSGWGAQEPPAIVAGSRGRGSAGRAQPCQGWGRGFESRRPLQNTQVMGTFGAGRHGLRGLALATSTSRRRPSAHGADRARAAP